MFALYRQRVGERIGYARGLLKGGFDFSGNERYEYDRKDVPWAANGAALDALWKQSVKNDWLRLKLAGKKPDEIRKTLDKRYANMLDSINELKGDEVFQSFLNAYAAAIDPHTDYMTPRSATKLQHDDLQFAGGDRRGAVQAGRHGRGARDVPTARRCAAAS